MYLCTHCIYIHDRNDSNRQSIEERPDDDLDDEGQILQLQLRDDDTDREDCEEDGG